MPYDMPKSATGALFALWNDIKSTSSHSVTYLCSEKTDDVKLYAISCLVLFVYNLKTASR